MTEAEWLECEAAWENHERVEDDWQPASEAWRSWPGLTERKCRLFAAVCCRRIWRYIPDGEPQRVIEAMECVEDGKTTEWEIARRYYESPIGSTRVEKEALSAVSACCLGSHIELAAIVAAHSSSVVRASGEGRSAWHEWGRAEWNLFHELLGNPTSPVVFLPEWRTDTATAIARQLHESRDFSAMPILGDALQDAGCDNNDILNHCRDVNQVHVRGCWVVDAVLGWS